MPPKGAGPPSPPCPGPRSIPAAPASLPRRAAGAGRGARRLRRGRGGLLGSQARIKYLLCFVWPLGEGRGGLSHRSGAAGKAGPGPGARAVPKPGAPEPPGRAGTEHPGRGPRAAGRWAALTDLGYRAEPRGAAAAPETTPPRGRRALCDPDSPSVGPARRPGARAPPRRGPSGRAAPGRALPAPARLTPQRPQEGFTLPFHRREINQRQRRGEGARLGTGTPQSPGLPHQARPASGRSFSPEWRVAWRVAKEPAALPTGSAGVVGKGRGLAGTSLGVP